jgi:hypothetical protein
MSNDSTYSTVHNVKVYCTIDVLIVHKSDAEYYSAVEVVVPVVPILSTWCLDVEVFQLRVYRLCILQSVK